MMFRKQFSFLLVLPLFLLASCARQTSPTGGPKDTIPPHLVRSYPRNEQINFNSQQIELLFDEDIIVNNPKEQIIITPDIGKEYNAVAKKNKVIITLDKKLKDSTTFSFNFRDAVADITEKNPATNLKLAISTGSYIDSLSIDGTIRDPLTNKTLPDITVSLYQQDTFNILKHKPPYLTKSDKNGKYIIENLKPGIYHVYAADDKNKNLIVDSKTELYGFLAESIDLEKNQKRKDINLARVDLRPLKMTNSRPYNTYFNIKTSKNLSRFKITSPNEIPMTAFGEDKANIRVYNTFDAVDSVQIHLTAFDSVNNKIDTTLYAKFNKREVKKETFTTKTDGVKVLADKGILHGYILYNKPLLAINFDSILYRIDTVKTVRFTTEDFTIDSLHNLIQIYKTFDKNLLAKPVETKAPKPTVPKDTAKTLAPVKPKNTKPAINNEFYFGKAALISIELDSSKRSADQLKPVRNDENAILFFEVKTREPHYTLQLLDKSFKILKVIHDTPKGAFEDNPPGEYQLRLVIDKDNNGEWSPGNYLTNTEPEPIIFYQSEKGLQSINLKANWEVGPLLIKF
jgi:hypothetical protein